MDYISVLKYNNNQLEKIFSAYIGFKYNMFYLKYILLLKNKQKYNIKNFVVLIDKYWFKNKIKNLWMMGIYWEMVLQQGLQHPYFHFYYGLIITVYLLKLRVTGK